MIYTADSQIVCVKNSIGGYAPPESPDWLHPDKDSTAAVKASSSKIQGNSQLLLKAIYATFIATSWPKCTTFGTLGIAVRSDSVASQLA